jgi:NADPH-dependent 2,4-dienoyl-CoA reductase/sulfur reductase-like enzyme
VIGGGLVGCETAEFILENGDGVATVTVVEMLDRMAATISPTYRPFFLARLKKMGVRMETSTAVAEITAKGVKVKRKGEPGFIEGRGRLRRRRENMTNLHVRRGHNEG